jgi:hypothetical protein
MENSNRFQVITETRQLLEKGEFDYEILLELYQEYNYLDDIHTFLESARKIFPMMNCGIATVCLKHRLKAGKIIRGSYAGYGHTFLGLEGDIIADVTADQFNGPAIYLGQLKKPWALEAV